MTARGHLSALAERGLVLREVSFASLVQAREAAMKRGAFPLMPMFTPSRGATGVAFVAGELSAPVLTGAVVLRDCPIGLRAAINDLTLFGDVAAPGEYAHVHGGASLLDDVRGVVAVIGAVWRDPDTCGGTLRLLWPVLVESSLRDERVEWIVGLIRGRKWLKIGADIEGFRHFWEGVTYRDPDWGGGYEVEDFVICAMSRREALERVLKTGESA